MIAIEIDRPGKLSELSLCRGEELMHAEPDGRVRLAGFAGFVGGGRREDRTPRRNDQPDSIYDFHKSLVLLRWFIGRAFNKGVRDIGNFPNKLPRANAGSCFNILLSWTPAMRARLVSKYATARRSGSE